MARRFLFEKNRPHTIVRMNGKKVGTKADLRVFSALKGNKNRALTDYEQRE